jgi:uncharacterized protein (TIGR02217 family)
MAFYESPRFPLIPAPDFGAGPEYSTDVVAARSGFEARNINWDFPRRRFNAALGVKTIQDAETLLHFFHVMQGRGHGFRIKDYTDYKSSGVRATPANTDQIIGTGDGTNRIFQLTKRYVAGANTRTYNIKKPVAGTVIVAVNGIANTLWTIDTSTGVITFNVGQAPAAAATVTAGYEYDVPARFDTDLLNVQMLFEAAGQMDVPVIEIRV